MLKFIAAAAVAVAFATSPALADYHRDHDRDRDRHHHSHMDRDHHDRHHHYRAGGRYSSAPHGWHRYHHRPRDWRTRGCIVVGPIWFCP
jgi:Ni/Co efflux regulator RcnB